MKMRSQARSGLANTNVEPMASANKSSPAGTSEASSNKGNRRGTAPRKPLPPSLLPLLSRRTCAAIRPSPGTPQAAVSSAASATRARKLKASLSLTLVRSLSHETISSPLVPSNSATKRLSDSCSPVKRGKPSSGCRHRRARLARTLAHKAGLPAHASSSTNTIREPRPSASSVSNHSPAWSRCKRVKRSYRSSPAAAPDRHGRSKARLSAGCAAVACGSATAW